jgi:hypothetical protein
LGVTVSIGTMFSQKFSQGINMGMMLCAGWGTTLIFVMALLYIWPTHIAPDPDNPLKWYYPCICACLNKSNKVGN